MSSHDKVEVIDADAHVIETERTWDYLEPSEEKFRPVLFTSPQSPTKQLLGHRREDPRLPLPPPTASSNCGISRTSSAETSSRPQAAPGTGRRPTPPRPHGQVGS